MEKYHLGFEIEMMSNLVFKSFCALSLCMPETPFPDDYNVNESTRLHLLPRPKSNVSLNSTKVENRYYLDGGLCNSVQITLSSLCDTTASLLLILLQYTDLLECLHDLAVYTSASIDVVRWATASVPS